MMSVFNGSKPFIEESGYPPLRLAVTGASGLIGSALFSSLKAEGHQPVCFVRRKPESGRDEIFWNPEARELDAGGLENLDGVIHLAGAPIAAGRWSEKRKAAILQSRQDGTGLISTTLASLKHPPRFLISASAIGYYGSCGPEPVTEKSPAGTGFLAEVCRAWEQAAAPARQAGIRVVHPRIGVVLSPAGGALARMLPAFRWGLGGPLGSGRQGVSWIALDDLIRVFHHLIRSDEISGPVNATAPLPVIQGELARLLGRVLRRPSIVPLPGFMVRVLFGEMGRRLLLEGAHVIPERLLKSGFRFRYSSLEPALRSML